MTTETPQLNDHNKQEAGDMHTIGFNTSLIKR